VLRAAREKGEFKARMLPRIQELDGRIHLVDVRAFEPGGSKEKAALPAIREARWRLDRASKAVQTAGDSEWKQARAEFEEAAADLAAKLDAVQGTKP
jgi:hypothetical protein